MPDKADKALRSPFNKAFYQAIGSFGLGSLTQILLEKGMKSIYFKPDGTFLINEIPVESWLQ